MDALSLIKLEVQAEASKLLAVYENSKAYGLSITKAQAIELVEEKNKILMGIGRIELENNTIEKILNAFGTSSYISSVDYMQTLHELVRIFYYCRCEFTLNQSDDDLIDWMLESFEGECAGSTDLLEGRALDEKLHGNYEENTYILPEDLEYD